MTANDSFGARPGDNNVKEYDLVVIGGGAAGLTAAAVAVNLGARTLLVEADRLGGDCTWDGCVPSKTLLKSAQTAHEVRHSETYGIRAEAVEIDFERVMQRVRAVREGVYQEDDHPRNFEAMGIDVRSGRARFLDPHHIEIQTQGRREVVRARYVVIATGARSFVPPIEGLADIPYLTSRTLFELEKQPGRMAVIGAGPVGTEMAQAFNRLGTAVFVFEEEDRILPNENPELARMLQERLAQEGIHYYCGSHVKQVRETADDAIIVDVERDGKRREVTIDVLYVAAGRRADVDGLNLEAAGVTYTNDGITVNDRCRTSKRHIYASGDVTGRYQFTHMSEHMSKVAVINALLKIPKRIDTGCVPWVTYTDPELAHVGAMEQELSESGVSYETYRFPYEKVDRAVTDGDTLGSIKVFAKRWNGKILGASILGRRAGALISEFAVALKHGVTLRELSDTIHPYPSYGLGARRAADQWYAQKQSPMVTRILQAVFGYSGPVIEPDPDRIV